jgi:hypothetical protein
MGGRVGGVLASIASGICALSLGCGSEPNALHPPRAPLANADVERWERESTILVECPPAETRHDRPCGLLSDTLSPAEAASRLADRYPLASVAEMRGTCGLDPECDARTRELVWLESHNRRVARRAEEVQMRWSARRHDDGGAGRTVGFVLGVGVALAGVAIGASRGVR